MSSKKILIIDDDVLMRRSLAYNLEQNGFHTTTAGSAEDGLLTVQINRPDLILLDIGLPGMDGLQALKEFRDKLGLPVILLTARRRELDEVLGLELGADDYVTKPFNFDVLLAHVKAVLRRSAVKEINNQKGPIIAGRFTIDVNAHIAILDGCELSLTPHEFGLLYVLVQNAGKVVSAEDLLTAIWGAEFVGEPQVVYVHMRGLRNKVESDPTNPRLIQTIRGIGYRLNIDQE
jgi:DNA-binding response OmpR family regulator